MSREAGTLDSLRPLLDFVFVAAAMSSDHLAGPRLHVHGVAPVCLCERRQAQGQQQAPQTHSTNARTPLPHSVGAVWSRSAQQEDLSPHSRSAIRHGAQAGIPFSKNHTTTPLSRSYSRAHAHTHQPVLLEQEKLDHSHPPPLSGHRETTPRADVSSSRRLLLSKDTALTKFRASFSLLLRSNTKRK